MNGKNLLLATGLVSTLAALAAAQDPVGWRARADRRFTVTADRVAADNVMRTAVLTGHVDAVSGPFHAKTECAYRDADGVMKLTDPTTLTTCTNHPGVCHWSLRGEMTYLDGKYVEGRNVWLEFYEVPVFWLPYVYYPFEGQHGLRVMPGYTGRWGAYLLTKYLYNIAGDRTYQDNTWWLRGSTRFDLRSRNGVAAGETLNWNLGDFGRGRFKIYYAWDEDYDRYDYTPSRYGHGRRWGNWDSDVDRDRYAIELSHRWDATERDVVRFQGTIVSDTHFKHDFFRNGAMTLRNDWLGYEGNEVAWEHNENSFAAGVGASGPLNDFYGGTSRLPEFYFDIQPMPVWTLPVNYESENRIGYLTRQPAEYGDGDKANPYTHNPGVWADYETFRFDTYHRLTAPFRTFDDILSVVPRIGYHGTWWDKTGEEDLTGWNSAKDAGDAFRSIVEGGATFAARGKAWIDDEWQHTVEPYLDLLLQESWTADSGDGSRPYVFDSIDASRMWEDQFAGRSRNLPYSYYGITPGVRNAFDALDERGHLHQILDVDVYAAVEFTGADFIGSDKNHKLADVDSPNYGRNNAYIMPGIRTRWHPADDVSLLARFEYDPDNNKLAYGDLGWKQTVTKDFNYYVNYAVRDYRWWDFSSAPYDPDYMKDDRFNWFYCHQVTVGFTHQPIDWFAWSPFIRWDIREEEVDSVGAWFDYLTDCLGFRLLVEYESEYTWVDGYERDDDFHVGFYIYLRALGADSFGDFFN